MSGQVSGGSAGEYQADERAGQNLKTLAGGFFTTDPPGKPHGHL